MEKLHRLSDADDWFYVKLADNAADLISRGYHLNN